jgi:hypothetical protein
MSRTETVIFIFHRDKYTDLMIIHVKYYQEYVIISGFFDFRFILVTLISKPFRLFLLQ